MSDNFNILFITSQNHLQNKRHNIEIRWSLFSPTILIFCMESCSDDLFGFYNKSRTYQSVIVLLQALYIHSWLLWNDRKFFKNALVIAVATLLSYIELLGGIV